MIAIQLIQSWNGLSWQHPSSCLWMDQQYSILQMRLWFSFFFFNGGGSYGCSKVTSLMNTFSLAFFVFLCLTVYSEPRLPLAFNRPEDFKSTWPVSLTLHLQVLSKSTELFLRDTQSMTTFHHLLLPAGVCFFPVSPTMIITNC